MLDEVKVSYESLCQLIITDGFAMLAGDATEPVLSREGPLSDWGAFAASWDDLHLDRHMADGGRYRRRRHANYLIDRAGEPMRQPHRAHYQSHDYNRLNGGIARWFEPVTEAIGAGATLRTILLSCRHVFGALAPDVRTWEVEVHQFRIEAQKGEEASPTPEGMHRDGVDYVLVLLVTRQNIVSGTTAIYSLDGRELGSFTLTNPMDAVWLEDARVYHGVTAVEPENPGLPAYRDVLVVTFRDRTAAPA